jgi:mercuric ion binding protein
MMKTYLVTSIFIVTLSAAVSAETIKATVNGMVCGFCATAIEKTFHKQPEVQAINVDLNHRLVTVTTKAGQSLEDGKITQLLKNSGYTVVKIDRAK